MKVKSPSEMTKAIQVRIEIFVKEQNVPFEEEIDDRDQDSTHFLLQDTLGKPYGTARLVPGNNSTCYLGRLAVCKEVRKKGFGKMLVEAVEDEAKKLGYNSILIHGQTYAQGFYESMGFIDINEPRFWEAGIEHLHIKKELQK